MIAKRKNGMETIATVNFFVFIVIFIVVTSIGLDIKKISSWLFGLYGFASGFFIIYVSRGSLGTSIKAGLIIAFISILSGVITRRKKQRADDGLPFLW